MLIEAGLAVDDDSLHGPGDDGPSSVPGVKRAIDWRRKDAGFWLGNLKTAIETKGDRRIAWPAQMPAGPDQRRHQQKDEPNYCGRRPIVVHCRSAHKTANVTPDRTRSAPVTRE
jgi:hypothetical protein